MINLNLRSQSGIISLIIGPIVVVVLFLLGLLFQQLSFSTPEEIKNLRGEGRAESFDFPYDEVFRAALDVLTERGLTVVESNSDRGFIVVAEGSGFVYEGRIMAVFISPAGGSTGVEIVTKLTDIAPIGEILFPKNPPDEIFRHLGGRLDAAQGAER